MIKELKPGEIIEYKGYKIKAVEDNGDLRCSRCCFDNFFGVLGCYFAEHVIGECRSSYRKDRKDIRFELIDE